MIKNKTESDDMIYICVHQKSGSDYYVLPYKNGLAAARIVTGIYENSCITGWQAETVISLEGIKENIRWYFSDRTDLYDFLCCENE